MRKLTFTKGTKTMTMLINGSDVQLEVQGFHGPACLKATKGIEDALGKVVERTETAEMHERDTSCQLNALDG